MAAGSTKGHFRASCQALWSTEDSIEFYMCTFGNLFEASFSFWSPIAEIVYLVFQKPNTKHMQ